MDAINRDDRERQTPEADDAAVTKLPAWCDVYEGLTDEEIAEIEKIALTRADMTRPTVC